MCIEFIFLWWVSFSNYSKILLDEVFLRWTKLRRHLWIVFLYRRLRITRNHRDHENICFHWLSNRKKKSRFHEIRIKGYTELYRFDLCGVYCFLWFGGWMSMFGEVRFQCLVWPPVGGRNIAYSELTVAVLFFVSEDCSGFRCNNGECRTRLSDKCDGVRDCSDGSDEVDCGRTYFCNFFSTISEAVWWRHNDGTMTSKRQNNDGMMTSQWRYDDVILTAWSRHNDVVMMLKLGIGRSWNIAYRAPYVSRCEVWISRHLNWSLSWFRFRSGDGDWDCGRGRCVGNYRHVGGFLYPLQEGEQISQP